MERCAKEMAKYQKWPGADKQKYLVGLVRDSLVTAESGKYGEVMTMKGEFVDEVNEDVVLQVVIRSPGFKEGGTLVGLLRIRSSH